MVKLWFQNKHEQELADFVEATSAPAIETAREEVQNIEIEDVIEDDIIKPIHRQYSEVMVLHKQVLNGIPITVFISQQYCHNT